MNPLVQDNNGAMQTGNTIDPSLSQSGAYVPYVPYVPPPAERPTKQLRTLQLKAPFQWLLAGWHDQALTPRVTLFFGTTFWLMWMVLKTVLANKPEYLMTVVSGCFLVGPFLAMGLYEASRLRQLGEPERLLPSLLCWRPHIKSMAMLVLVLIVLELLWGRASLIVFALFFSAKIQSTVNIVELVFNPNNWVFVAVYACVGGFFAALVFCTCVVSIPMILDRDTDAFNAVLLSLQVALKNPLTLLLWGACIVLVLGVGLAMPLGIGVVVVGPILGYASWHAYRASIEWYT